MNDFTKEELQYFFERIDTAWKYERDLYKKVKSMIENYCEHEPHGDFHVCVDKCKKCGVIVNDN